MSDEQRRQDLADFLRTRRMRLSPESFGLIRGRRRTPGLRREEVAQLANVSVSWYTLLEQGRDIHASDEVLYGIADALQLTPDERQHLLLLAREPKSLQDDTVEEQISPALRRVLDALNPLPAYIIGRRWNYLAWNTAAEQVLLLSRPSQYAHNVVWRIFADPTIRALFDPHWEWVAQKVLAEFRADSAHFVNEEWFTRMITDLQRVSPEFRVWWSRYDVRGRSDALKQINHPVLGCLMFEHTSLQVSSTSDLKMMIETPLPETDTLAKLQQLLGQNVAVPVL